MVWERRCSQKHKLYLKTSARVSLAVSSYITFESSFASLCGLKSLIGKQYLWSFFIEYKSRDKIY